jgi:hypothetical protein
MEQPLTYHVLEVGFKKDIEKAGSSDAVYGRASNSYKRSRRVLNASSAGWLTLLQTLDLESVFSDKVEIREALATTTPSDIPAAVAYGTIESLITLTAAAGCKSVFMDGEYPTCWAPGLQLNFRSHDSLGLVAAFATYRFKPVYRTITEEDLKQAYFHNQGILKYVGEDIQNPFVVMNRTVRAKGAYGPIWIDKHVAADLYGSGPGNPPQSHSMVFYHVGGICLLETCRLMSTSSHPSICKSMQLSAL